MCSKRIWQMLSGGEGTRKDLPRSQLVEFLGEEESSEESAFGKKYLWVRVLVSSDLQRPTLALVK